MFILRCYGWIVGLFGCVVLLFFVVKLFLFFNDVRRIEVEIFEVYEYDEFVFV